VGKRLKEPQTMTKVFKVANFDRVQQERDKFSLALYDIYNCKFQGEVRFSAATIREQFDARWEGGQYVFTLSMRGNPLLLSRYSVKGQGTQIEVHTDTEVLDMYRVHPMGLFERMAMTARNELMHEFVGVSR
jgi:hypothetical protein